MVSLVGRPGCDSVVAEPASVEAAERGVLLLSIVGLRDTGLKLVAASAMADRR